MGGKTKKIEADVVIAGTGPGGCAIAKHLSKKGKKVVLLEKGGDNTLLFGTPLGIYLKMEKLKFLRILTILSFLILSLNSYCLVYVFTKAS